MLDELQTTAERVERFRAIHEDAVRDLRQKIAEARAEGYDHDEIDSRIRGGARFAVRPVRRVTDFRATERRRAHRRAEDRFDGAVTPDISFPTQLS